MTPPPPPAVHWFITRGQSEIREPSHFRSLIHVLLNLAFQTDFLLSQGHRSIIVVRERSPQAMEFLLRLLPLWGRRNHSWTKHFRIWFGLSIVHINLSPPPLCPFFHREREILAYLGQCRLFCCKLTHFLVYFYRAWYLIRRWCSKIDKFQVCSYI